MATLPQHRSTSRLPGVGERLDATDANGTPLVVIRRRSGDVELHPGDGPVIELDGTTASTIGAFVSGHFLLAPEIADRLSDVLGGLTFDWVRLERDDHAVGRTIAELEIRRRTGITIVAILRGSIPIVTPDPQVRLEAGDELVIAGREQDEEAFVRFLTRGR